MTIDGDYNDKKKQFNLFWYSLLDAILKTLIVMHFAQSAQNDETEVHISLVLGTWFMVNENYMFHRFKWLVNCIYSLCFAARETGIYYVELHGVFLVSLFLNPILNACAHDMLRLK